MKIWGRPNSICTQRVLWALAEADVPYQLTLASATMGPQGHISAGGAPFGVVDTPAYAAMNPNRTVPTIDDDGFVLWESNAIVAYVAQRYAPQRLFGGDLRSFALASQWMAWTNEHLEPWLHTLVMELVRLPPARRDATAAEAARQGVLASLRLLDAHLANAPFVAGASFTMGDIPAGAAAYRWRLFVPGAPPLPHLAAWQARLAERDGFHRHVAPPEFHMG
jgi:glutathione S-transferase